jgi:hypothetical protein
MGCLNSYPSRGAEHRLHEPLMGDPRVRPQPELVVLTTDAKGIVMRQEDLRDATRAKAEAQTHKLDKRLCPGEKRQAKRMAQVAIGEALTQMLVVAHVALVLISQEHLEHLGDGRILYRLKRLGPMAPAAWCSSVSVSTESAET